MDDARYEVARVEKNRRQVVAVALTEYSGRSLLDVRIFGDFAEDGEFRPTHKGISLRIDRLPDLIEALEKARDEAERRGLIGGGA